MPHFFFISSNKSAIYAEQKVVYNIEQPKQNYTEKDLDSYFCLRDENIIFTANQGNLGLCWAFGAIKSLESTLAVKYNEVYDFSEAWISLCLKLYRSSNNKSYQMGAGAEIPDFWNVLQNYGLVLESDFPYEMYMGFDETNMMEYYEYYKQFANKDIIKLLDKVDMTTLSNSSFNSKETIKQAKLHIMNHGGLYIAFKSQNASTKDVSNGKNKIKAYCNTSGSGDHSVAVLGWDDDITVTTKSGTEMKGAWICLNSWGNIEDDGFIYIMYEDTSIYDLVGFEINEEISEFSVNMTKSTSYVENLYKNYAKAKYEDFDIQRLKQGNMFYLGDTVDITYNSSVDVKNVNVEIYESGEICTDLNIDKENRKIRLYSSDLKQGCYKLLFSFDKDLDGNIDQQIVKQIFMTSGVIFDGSYTAMVTKPLPWVDFNDDDNLIKPSLPSESGGAELGNSVIFTQGYSTQSIKFKTANIPTCISSQLCANSIYIGSYSTITKIEVTNYTDKPYSTSFLANYFKSQKSYSTYRYLIQMEFTNQNCKVGDIKFIDLTFTTDRGHTETLRINFIITDQSKNDDIIYLNYLTNINNVVDCPKIAYYNGNDILIPSANNKTYYTFEKWCTDNNLTNNINQNGNNYTITANLNYIYKTR